MDIVERVASIGSASDRAIYRELLLSRRLVPGGQILRGAGCEGAVLYNCFVTGVGAVETVAEIAARITRWTRLGAGVGVNLDAIAFRERAAGRGVCDAIDAIALSQHGLWNEGIRRTATMVTLSLRDPEVVAAAALMTQAPHMRHLNLGVVVRDSDLREQAAALDVLARTIWRTGNPGFLFIDRIQKDHLFGETVLACNPCGEQFLAEEEGCNLASVNLAAFVNGRDFDFETFRETVAVAVRFLDDVVEASAYPSEQTRVMAMRRRRIGLGVLGFATALHHLGIPYGSVESIQFANQLAVALREAAEVASIALAGTRGAYPDDPSGSRRNSHLLSIAPTGAISMLWEVSSGIEPMFGDVILKGDISVDFRTGGVHRPLRGHEVPSVGHIAILSAWQAQVDGGISKTVNLPEQASTQDVRAVIDLAHAEGCKGVSIFRDNSRAPAILAVDHEAQSSCTACAA